MTISGSRKIASMLVVASAAAGGAALYGHQPAPAAAQNFEPPVPATRVAEAPTFRVERGKLTVLVNERGYVEAAHNEQVYSPIEGSTTIMRLLPEGTRVKKGQFVCELDSAGLKDRLMNQRIAVEAAQNAFEQARIAHEVARVAVSEYLEGIYKQEQGSLKGTIAAAQSAISKAEARRQRTARARDQLKEAQKAKPDAASPAVIMAELDVEDRLDAAEQAVIDQKQTLEQAQSKLDSLEKFTKKRKEKSLNLAVSRAQVEMLAREAAFALERQRVEKLERQIAGCTINAPSDGAIVYANDPSRSRGLPMIEEGAVVRERQLIFSVPDVGGPMQINTKVAEAIVDQLSPGQKARIRVDAFPGKLLTGEVTAVAPLPDPPGSLRSGVKVYTTRVKIHEPLPSLRPGMTASVEIVSHELDDVLSVPVQAVVRYDGKDHVAVKGPDGAAQWREVRLGVANPRYVEVRQGLQAGDEVVLDPVSLMSDEEKRAKIGPAPAADTRAQGPADAVSKSQDPSRTGQRARGR